MSETPSIFEKHERRTYVAFGWGTIQVGFATSGDQDEQAEVHLGDTLGQHEIGSDTGPWENAQGRTVVLGFNKVSSIEVLEEALQKAKKHLETQQRREREGD